MAIFKKINPEIEKLPLKNMFIFSLLSSLAIIILGLISQLILPPEIPLFYGLPQTTEQLAPSIFIVLPSIASALIIAVNIIIAIKLNDNYLKKTLSFASMIMSILSAVTTLKIILLVGSI